MSKNSKARQRSQTKAADSIYLRARCDQELKDRVNKWAKLHRTNESNFVREAVDHYFAHLKNDGPRHSVTVDEPDPNEAPEEFEN